MHVAMGAGTMSTMSTMRGRFLLLLALPLAACSATPSSNDVAYKAGSLGNGSFLFDCDDSVACARWSNNAKEFPTLFTTGSNFNLAFIATEDQGNTNLSTGNGTYPGLTIEAVGPYVGKGPDGFAALQPGYGSVIAHDKDGKVIDFITLHIVKPEALVVYDAEYTGAEPVPVDAVGLATDDRARYRTVGETRGEPSAGSIRVEWTSDDPSIVAVESYVRGVVTLHALRHGSTAVTAAGAALTKRITVVVQ